MNAPANYTVQTRINRPVEVVFEAIVNENLLSAYFTDRSSGPLVEGAQVRWHWEVCGELPVSVVEVVPNERIVLTIDSQEWGKTEDEAYPVEVRLKFEHLEEDATMLSISETGWRVDESGLRGSHENCSGWTHMAMCLKAYLEHDLDLRDRNG